MTTDNKIVLNLTPFEIIGGGVSKLSAFGGVHHHGAIQLQVVKFVIRVVIRCWTELSCVWFPFERCTIPGHSSIIFSNLLISLINSLLIDYY